jgi:hypothetical protein
MENSIVVIRSNVKRITLQRVLCSKIAWRGEVTLEEIHVLFQNQLWLEQKCQTDGQFEKKFGRSLEDLSVFLKQANLSRGLTEGAVGLLGVKLKTLTDFILPSRNLGQMELLIGKSFYTRPYKESGIPTKQLPPKKVIGRGYRDHGTARNSAVDGSPRWQEVASHVTSIERRIHELRERLHNEEDSILIRLRLTAELSDLHKKLEGIRSSGSNSKNAKETKR